MQSSQRILRYFWSPPKYILNCPRETKTFSTQASPKSIEDTESRGKWQIIGSVCITRPPVICQPMTPLEEEFAAMISQMEKENSLRNNHELRVEQDRIRAELLKTGDLDSSEIEESAMQTALEYEDACTEELKVVTFGSKITEADKIGNLSTLDRALDRSLVLLVNQKLGEDYRWIFPQAPWTPGETLRQTCERVVQEKCGRNIKVKFFGNAPCGFFKYKYPKQVRDEGYLGAKVFFYKAQVRGVNEKVLPGVDISGHEWLTHDQLDERLKNSYAKTVSQFLVSDQ